MSASKLLIALLLGGCLNASLLHAQNEGSPTPGAPAPATTASQPTKPEDSQSAPEEKKPPGKVLFSRSDEESKAGDKAPAQVTGSGQAEAALLKTRDEEQPPLVFVAYDLDIHLTPHQQSLAVRARVTVRNESPKPLKRIALQLSSSLKWERVRAWGAEAAFAQHPLDSDADHTGAVNEAVIDLPREFAPREDLTLEIFYSGIVPLASERLERLGAPNQIAERSDWDEISAEFIGLRGFGNVIWYPVSARPVMLGDGAKLFAEIGRQNQRQQQAKVSMTVTSEYSADNAAPNLAVLNGRVVPVVPAAAPANSYPGVVTATLPPTTLGFAAPSLFLLSRQKVEGTGVAIYALKEDLGSAPAYLRAIGLVTPLVQQWLGKSQKSSLSIIGLPHSGDLAAEEGAAYFTGFKASPEAKEVENAMVHSLAHAFFYSPRVWLNEGVPQFLGSLWIEQIQGRQAALEALSADRGGLALAEPGAPGESAGEDLIQASNIVYYRAKSAYVLWMLRDLAGDAALGATLRAYVAEADLTPEYFETLLEKMSGKDLKWFFDGWVYHDRGLPDLTVGGVYPAKASVEGQWLVALDIANDGYVEAEVPVTVRSKDATVTERLRLPARSKVSRRVLIGGKPTQVQVNDGTVPEVAETVHITKLVAETP